MPIWAKIDVDMPTDGKLLGQPVATRHLWTCLICLARKQDDHGAVRGYDCALLAGANNLPRKAVATALTYFQAARLIELDTDGTIRVLKYMKWYGDKTLAEQRTEWRDRQTKSRGGVTRDKAVTSQAKEVRDIGVSHASSSSGSGSGEDKKNGKDTAAGASGLLVGGDEDEPDVTPEQRSCRRAIAQVFAKKYADKSGGTAYRWGVGDRKGIIALSRAADKAGIDPAEGIRLVEIFVERSATDSYYAKNFKPRFIASEINALRLPPVARGQVNGHGRRANEPVHADLQSDHAADAARKAGP